MNDTAVQDATSEAAADLAAGEVAGAVADVQPVCVHRWVIESPNGATSHGVCRNCRAEKEFPNSAEDGLWEREVPQSRWTGRSDWKPANNGF